MARTTNSNTLTRPIYATVGVTDRAVELVRGSVSEFQSTLSDLQEAKTRRAAIEARVNELQNRALYVPVKVQGFLEKHELAYDQLVARGDALVRRVRRQKSTQDTVKAARTTSSKAKTTSTQAGNSGKSTASTAKSSAKSAAKSTTTTAKRRSQAPKSSVKATATGARKTATSAAKATSDAAKKVGD